MQSVDTRLWYVDHGCTGMQSCGVVHTCVAFGPLVSRSSAVGTGRSRCSSHTARICARERVRTSECAARDDVPRTHQLLSSTVAPPKIRQRRQRQQHGASVFYRSSRARNARTKHGGACQGAEQHLGLDPADRGVLLGSRARRLRAHRPSRTGRARLTRPVAGSGLCAARRAAAVELRRRRGRLPVRPATMVLRGPMASCVAKRHAAVHLKVRQHTGVAH